MELRFQTARTTKDLDFTVRVAPAGRDDILLKQIQDAGAVDLGDFFSFRIGEAMMDLDGAPYGGARYPVESLMGGRTFVKFHLDVGIGDVVLDPLEQAHMRDWLGFAGILPPAVPMIQREQQFVEKLHAYTLPRTDAQQSGAGLGGYGATDSIRHAPIRSYCSGSPCDFRSPGDPRCSQGPRSSSRGLGRTICEVGGGMPPRTLR